MNDIQNGILTLLPPKRKATPSGWTSFNAPCCVHNSERRDERQRGGILLNGNGGFQYHCFNCNFKLLKINFTQTGWLYFSTKN